MGNICPIIAIPVIATIGGSLLLSGDRQGAFTMHFNTCDGNAPKGRFNYVQSPGSVVSGEERIMFDGTISEAVFCIGFGLDEACDGYEYFPPNCSPLSLCFEDAEDPCLSAFDTCATLVNSLFPCGGLSSGFSFARGQYESKNPRISGGGDVVVCMADYGEGSMIEIPDQVSVAVLSGPFEGFGGLQDQLLDVQGNAQIKACE